MRTSRSLRLTALFVNLLLTACGSAALPAPTITPPSAREATTPSVVAASPVVIPTPGTAARRMGEKVTQGQGYKQLEEGIIVVHLKGTDAQMREQMDFLLKDESAAFNTIIRRNRMIQGLGGGCTNFAAFGSASADGRLWHGRNFDFYGLGAMDRYRVVYIVEPEGKIPFAAIGWAGWSGPEQVHTAMNAQGVSIGYNWSNSNQESIADAPRLWQLLRRVVEGAHSIDEAIAILEKGPRFSSANLLIADGKVPDAVVVEMTSKKMTVRRATDGAIYATNHFVTPIMQEPIKDPNSFARYERVGTLLQANRAGVNLEKAVSFLRDYWDGRTGRPDLSGDVIAWNINLQSEVFSPADLTFWVAKGAAPAAYGEYVGFSLKEELAGTQGPTRLSTIPEDPVIHTAAFSTFQSFQTGYLAYLEGDYAAAVTEFEKAVAAEPSNGKYRFLLASAYTNQQDYPRAIQGFQQALATDLNEVYQAYAYYRLAEIYEGMGDREKMRAAYQKVLEQAIGDPEIEEPARRALSSTGS